MTIAWLLCWLTFWTKKSLHIRFVVNYNLQLPSALKLRVSENTSTTGILNANSVDGKFPKISPCRHLSRSISCLRTCVYSYSCAVSRDGGGPVTCRHFFFLLLSKSSAANKHGIIMYYYEKEQLILHFIILKWAWRCTCIPYNTCIYIL